MSLRQGYNKLVLRTQEYLIKRREQGKWERFLPERIFDPQLWLWDQRSLAVGIGWGAALAITPVPMQSLFAAFICLWVRGNVPIGILACWLSFPGYQVIAWPLQWALGAYLLRELSPWTSGTSYQLIAEAAAHWNRGKESIEILLQGIHLPTLIAEFLIGCVLSSALLGLLFYGLIKSLPKKFFS